MAPPEPASPWLAVHDTLFAAFGPQHWWPGETPFEVMVGAILTQNTAWTNVERAIANLKRQAALNPRIILDTEDAQLAEWIRPAGAFNVKTRRLKAWCEHLAREQVLDDPARLGQGTPLPALRAQLLAVHGVGEETADAILLYALGRPSFVVDAYTRRIFSRLGLLHGGESHGAIRDGFMRELAPDPALFNEYHALVVHLGKEFCRTRPMCPDCPLARHCRHAQGIALPTPENHAESTLSSTPTRRVPV